MNIKHITLLLSITLVMAYLPLSAANAPDHTAVLVLSEEIFGKIFIHDENDELVVQLTKRVGRKIELGLDEGEYLIINIPEERSFKAWVTLKEGTRTELDADDLEPESVETFPDSKPEHECHPSPKEPDIPRETILGGESYAYFFGEVGTKSTEVNDEFAILVGGQLGWTFNRCFSIGFAAYGRAEHEDECGTWHYHRECDYRGPAYGGITTVFIFPPRNLIHFKAGALFGAGYAWDRHFYIFEPEIDIVLNISQIVRLQAGISYPLTDKETAGLEDIIFNVSFSFGK